LRPDLQHLCHDLLCGARSVLPGAQHQLLLNGPHPAAWPVRSSAFKRLLHASVLRHDGRAHACSSGCSDARSAERREDGWRRSSASNRSATPADADGNEWLLWRRRDALL